MRQVLGGAPITELLAQATGTAFHLETRDDYLADEESESLKAFRADESIDPGGAWFEPWTTEVADHLTHGITMRRVRIVSQPHTFYTRYLLALAHHNTAAGEDVRYLPREHADPGDAQAEDFWLLDDHVVAFSLFDERGVWVGAAATTEPRLVEHAIGIRDRVWPAAIPYREYVADHTR